MEEKEARTLWAQAVCAVINSWTTHDDKKVQQALDNLKEVESQPEIRCHLAGVLEEQPS